MSDDVTLKVSRELYERIKATAERDKYGNVKHGAIKRRLDELLLAVLDEEERRN